MTYHLLHVSPTLVPFIREGNRFLFTPSTGLYIRTRRLTIWPTADQYSVVASGPSPKAVLATGATVTPTIPAAHTIIIKEGEEE